MPNFPEIISENLIKFYIQDFENRNCINSKSGDLQINNSDGKLPSKIEIKCFTSQGPTSFGPTEKWEEIYFLDAINIFENGIIKIYKCNLPNDSFVWQNLQFNKNETFLINVRKVKDLE